MANPPITNVSSHPIRVGGVVHTKYPLNGLTVINKTGSAIAINKLVAVVGFDTTSGRPKIVLADGDVASHKNIYVTLEAVGDGALGIVWKGGRSTPVLDTSGAAAVGDPVYLDVTAGGFTVTAPTGADDDVVPVGWVTVKSATVGMIDWYIFPFEKLGTNSIQGGVTLTDPVISGTITGTYTVGGTPTLTAPRIVTTGKIVDAGGDEYVVFTEATTPITYIGIVSGDTTVAPAIRGQGETNTDLLLAGTGTGDVKIGDGADITKLLKIELVGATTAKTMTIASSQTDNRTLTLPDATDTLVGKATTDTLTNKSIVRTGQSYNWARAKVGATAGWVLGGADNLPYVATLPQSSSGSTLVIPLEGIKIGDTITGYTVNAQVESAGGAVTIDAALRAVTNVAADPTDAAIGTGMTQVSVTADTAVSQTKTGHTEVVAVGASYYILITATTAAVTDIILQHGQITVTTS